MARGRGRPPNDRQLKGFYIEPELELRMVKALTPEGQTQPPHGAQSDLINELIRQWLKARGQ